MGAEWSAGPGGHGPSFLASLYFLTVILLLSRWRSLSGDLSDNTGRKKASFLGLWGKVRIMMGMEA